MPLLDVQEIEVRFGGIVALDQLSLSLPPASLHCILGANGCGKTTLFNVLTGALKPTSGRVLFRGTDVAGRTPEAIARLGISRKFQVPGVYPELTVVENLELPLVAAGKKPRLSSLFKSRLEAEKLADLLAFSGLSGKRTVEAGQLAHGEKQRLEIAMLLAADADLLLLDEPTAGMSKGETQSVAQIVRKLCEERGKTVLVIEHDMNFVRELDCKVLVMARGSIIAAGSYAEVRSNPKVIESYLGKAA